MLQYLSRRLLSYLEIFSKIDRLYGPLKRHQRSNVNNATRQNCHATIHWVTQKTHNEIRSEIS